ncbi:hypothetical protein CDAR_573831 [Caerostris darwini]|uniref:Ribosomal protein L27 n=1 Tax=Caerostris darwini TaxID=1538125 RepID=A0AAV4MDQ7_9ARAC|nr:hypothetical protein CDAR_573831 [Caerostris darwini]
MLSPSSCLIFIPSSSPGPSNQRRLLLGDACAPQRGNYREGRPHVLRTRGSIVLKKQPGRYVTAVAKVIDGFSNRSRFLCGIPSKELNE